MIKRWRVKALFLTGLLCLALSRPVFGQEESVPGQAMPVEQLTADMNRRWGNIQDFQSDLTIGVQVSGKTTKIEGAVWQKERVFRTELTVPPEIITAMTGYRVSGLFKALMVFDGKTAWFSLPSMNMVMKTDISALGGKTNNAPFSKPLYLLPALSYSISEENRNGDDYYFLETGNIKDFFQKSAVSFMGMFLPTKPPLQSIGAWVNKGTLFPDSVEFYAQKNAAVMYVEFRNVKTDRGLSPELFVFKVPEGMQVMDMTETMKEMAGKMT
ncbi:MAG: hypothetical protein ABII89_01470 [Candidatus Omnitrophota bacterium]